MGTDGAGSAGATGIGPGEARGGAGAGEAAFAATSGSNAGRSAWYSPRSSASIAGASVLPFAKRPSTVLGAATGVLAVTVGGGSAGLRTSMQPIRDSGPSSTAAALALAMSLALASSSTSV
jgi:hypothetical protein